MKGFEYLSAIGITKEVDRLGRIVIPKEMRDFLKVKEGSSVEVLLTQDGILIRNPKYKVVEIDGE